MKKAQRAEYPNRLYNIVLRISGKEKNRILKAANKANLPLSSYILYCIWAQMRENRGIPAPGSAQYAIPDLQETLQAYFGGHALLKPCGLADCDMLVVESAGMKFCETCNIRIE